jgi:hypothetical protein
MNATVNESRRQLSADQYRIYYFSHSAYGFEQDFFACISYSVIFLNGRQQTEEKKPS